MNYFGFRNEGFKTGIDFYIPTMVYALLCNEEDMRKKKSSFCFHRPRNTSIAVGDSKLILIFLIRAKRSDQNFKTLGQDVKRCSKDSSASPQRVKAEEDLMPILLRRKFVTRYPFKILYRNARVSVSSATRNGHIYISFQSRLASMYISKHFDCTVGEIEILALSSL